MPHLSLSLDALGPVVQFGIGIAESRRVLLAQAKVAIPSMCVVRGLIDTGASCSAVDPEVLSGLRIPPSSYSTIHSVSTDGTPVRRPVYDVSLWLYHEATKHMFERSFPMVGVGLKSQGVDVLVGRDVLAECLFVYDGRDHRFALAF